MADKKELSKEIVKEKLDLDDLKQVTGGHPPFVKI